MAVAPALVQEHKDKVGQVVYWATLAVQEVGLVMQVGPVVVAVVEEPL